MLLLERPPVAKIASPAFREIEAELSRVLFDGIPLGPTLNDCWWVDFVEAHGDWRRRTRWLNRARTSWRRLHPLRADSGSLALPKARILVTWFQSTPRYDELLLPVLEELENGSYAVVFGRPNVVSCLPPGVPGARWEQVMAFDQRAWRAEYRRCRPEWERRLRSVCRGFRLPEGAFELLSLNLVLASQRVAGFSEFLKRSRPSVVVTEYDRNHLWSCLVLAANRLGIRTVTLVHGVMEQDAFGFSPVLADTILCWGEFDRAKLLAAGERPRRLWL